MDQRKDFLSPAKNNSDDRGPKMTIRRLFWIAIASALAGIATELGRHAAEDFRHIMEQSKPQDPIIPAMPPEDRPPPSTLPAPKEPERLTALLPDFVRPNCNTRDTVWKHVSEEVLTIWKCAAGHYFAFDCTEDGIRLITDKAIHLYRAAFVRRVYHYGRTVTLSANILNDHYYSYVISDDVFLLFQDALSAWLTSSQAGSITLDLTDLKYLSTLNFPPAFRCPTRRPLR
jgi:hypothetical protein